MPCLPLAAKKSEDKLREHISSGAVEQDHALFQLLVVLFSTYHNCDLRGLGTNGILVATPSSQNSLSILDNGKQLVALLRALPLPTCYIITGQHRNQDEIADAKNTSDSTGICLRRSGGSCTRQGGATQQVPEDPKRRVVIVECFHYLRSSSVPTLLDFLRQT